VLIGQVTSHNPLKEGPRPQTDPGRGFRIPDFLKLLLTDLCDTCSKWSLLRLLSALLRVRGRSPLLMSHLSNGYQ